MGNLSIFNYILIGASLYLIIGCIFLLITIHKINNAEKYINKKEKNKEKARAKLIRLQEIMERPFSGTDFDYMYDNELVKKAFKILLCGVVVLFWVIIILPSKKDKKGLKNE